MQPTTQATRGFFFKLGYFRELFTVSKMISNGGVTAIPINAACGCPLSATVEHGQLFLDHELVYFLDIHL